MSKTQKGSVISLVLVVGVIILVVWGIMNSNEMNACASQTESCLNRAGKGFGWQMFKCFIDSAGCIFSSVWDMVLSWFNKFF